MPRLEDHGIVLGLKPFAEGQAIVYLLSENHGKCAGLLSKTKKTNQGLQLGHLCHFTWSARLEEHLGRAVLEPLKDHAAGIFLDRHRLHLLNMVCALLQATLPERHPYPALFHVTHHFLETLGECHFLTRYIDFELLFLKEMGFGLAIDRCTVTGTRDRLHWVSPKSGKAVSEEPGRPYEDKLLPLPGFLQKKTMPDEKEILQAIDLTGYFMHKHLGALSFYNGWDASRQLIRNMVSNDEAK